MKKVFIPILFILSLLVFSSKTKAAASDIVFSEIMYDLAGADTDHEWVEIYNTGADPVTIIDGSSNDDGWRFNEGSTNHILTLAQGSLTLPAQGVAVLAGNSVVFLADHPGFSGSVIDTVMSLGNTSETIKLSADKGTTFFGEITYQNTWGGNGDGKSLEKINLNGANDAANWRAAIIDGGTPGLVSMSSSINSSDVSTSTSSPSLAISGNPPSPSSGGGGGSSVSAGTPTSTPAISLKAVAGTDVVAEINQTIKFDASKSEGASSYKWYWGDGSAKEGMAVDHAYQFPGTYLVTLEVSNGTEVALDQIKVSVFGGRAIINEIFTGSLLNSPAWIEVFNPTKTTLDISNWILESGDKSFVLPSFSTVVSGGYFVISQSVSGLNIFPGAIKLKYPNGLTIDEVVFDKIVEGASASRTANGFFWTKESTPGNINIVTSSGGALLENVKAVPNLVASKPESLPAKNYLASFYSHVSEAAPEYTQASASNNEDNSFWKKISGGLLFWIALVVATGLFIGLFYIKSIKK